MYDRPEAAGANDRLWEAVRTRLGEGPRQLRRGGDPWDDWTAPDLVLSQTCGLPYRTRLHGRVRIVAAPVWDLPCGPGFYDSVLVARADDPRDFAEMGGARLAYNEALSQSGWAAVSEHARSAGIEFGGGIATGSHLASARAVAEGRADLAGIDAVTWRMIRRWEPVAGRLREIGRTEPTPALPYITVRDDVATLRDALAGAIAELSTADRETLCLRGVIDLPESAWTSIPTPAPPPAAWSEHG